MNRKDDPLHGRTVPLSQLGWRERLRYMPDFVGYPPRAFFFVLALVWVMILTESAGVALLYPIVELMQNGGNAAAAAARSSIFSTIAEALGRIGIPVTFGWLMLTAAAVMVVRQVLTYLTTSYRAFVNYHAVEKIGSRTFLLFTQAGIDYAERFRSGSLINAVLTEAKRAGTLATAVQNIVSGVVRIAVYMVLLFVLSWQATVAGIILLGIAAVFLGRRTARASLRTGRRIATGNDALTRYAAERFGLIYLMKIAGTDKSESENFAARNASMRRLNVQMNRQAARLNALIEGSVVIGSLAIVYLAMEVLGMSLAALAVFLIAILRLMPVVQELAQSVQHIASCSSAIAYIDRINLEAAAAREQDTGQAPFHALARGISFEGVSFAYRNEDPDAKSVMALSDVSVEIQAGSTVALVGPSGAGKSTLMDLIPRLRQPTAGRILFDGVPANDIRLVELRNQIAVVLQDALVIDGTIEENLRYGHPGVDRETIIAAARAAHAHDFIERLPGGYDTVIGERGVLLSGGQKQRLALARALVGKSSILLLDEPTSALDAESEQAVQKALAELQASKTMTVIIIAHRLSTVRHADQIIVLENGKVLGSGTHDELIKSAPWYRRVVKLQLGDSFESSLRPTAAIQ